MKTYFLLRKGEKVEFQIPAAWKVLKNAVLQPQKAIQSVYELVDGALSNPIGTAPLKELILPPDRVAVVVDDCTRPTPRFEILDCLFDRLEQYGVSLDRADVVFALGTHRPMTDDEIRGALGHLMGRVRYWNHNACASDLVSVGRLPAAGEIRINPVVAAADFRISVGSVLPHPMNGFGGGAKNIFPGVGNFDAIRDHHNKLMLAEGAAFGNIGNNPFYHEICLAAKLARLDFIINSVFDARENVKAVVAGDFMEAFQSGVEMSRKGYAVSLPEKADVTIASAFPYEEAPQLIKPLCMAAEATRDGGVVILYAHRITGGRFPDAFLRAFDEAYGSGHADMRELVMTRTREGRLVASEAPMDFSCALNLALIHLSRVKAILVSGDTDAAQAGRIGFTYSRSIAEAVGMVERDHKEATINILPSGGLMVPMTG